MCHHMRGIVKQRRYNQTFATAQIGQTLNWSHSQSMVKAEHSCQVCDLQPNLLRLYEHLKKVYMQMRQVHKSRGPTHITR